MTTCKYLLSASSLAVLTCLMAGHALAQDKGSAPAAAPEAPQEVIVTALRRSESALKTPAAISVINGAELKTQGVNSVVDLQNLMPAVSMTIGQDGAQIGMRGVQPSDTSSKGEQDVAFNVDGVYIGRGNARTASFFDIDRVEVLTGPQGTLYGRSSTGGAINLITNKPKLHDYSGYARLEYGNYNTQRIEAAVNFPLGDTLAVRVATSLNRRDGYAKPVDYDAVVNGTTYHISAAGQKALNDQDDQTVRAALLFQPNDSFTGHLTVTSGHQGGVGGGAQLQDFLTSGSGDSKWNVLANPVPSFVDSKFTNIDAAITAKLGDVQLDVIASQQDFTLLQQRINTNSILYNGGQFSPILMHSPTKTSQFEARISNVNPGFIDYVAGVNYFYEDIHENGHIFNVPVSTPSDTTTWASFFEPKNETTHKSYGAFFQGTLHASEKLSFVGGVRYTFDEAIRVGQLALPFPPFNLCSYPNDCMGVPNNGKSSDRKVTWKLGANYQMDDANLLYASVATGFKGGGFNDYDPVANGVGNYDPSSLTAYEIGYKGRPGDHLILTSDAYYYDFTQNQINGVITFPLSGQTTPYTVTTPTRMYGLESTFNYRAATRTRFNGSLALEHSAFVRFAAGSIYGDQVSWADRPLDQTPTVVANLGLDQGFELPGGGSLKFHGQIKYSQGYYLSDIGNAVRYWQPAFTRSDMALTYAPAAASYSLQLFVQNIENSIQRTSAPANYVGPYGGVGGQTQVNGTPTYPTPGNGAIPTQPAYCQTFTTNTPRFYGVRLNVNF